MKFISVTSIIFVIFIGYVCHSVWVIYSLFSPAQCKVSSRSCLKPYPTDNLQIQVFASQRPDTTTLKQLTSILVYENFSISESFTLTENVSIPLKTRQNGSLYVHVFLYPKGESLGSTSLASHSSADLTMFSIPRSSYFNLLEMDHSSQFSENSSKGNVLPVTHFRNKLFISVMSGDFVFDRAAIPSELLPFIQLAPRKRQQSDQYLPILYIDELSRRVKDLKLVNISTKKLPLTVIYSPISVGKLRLWRQMFLSLQSLKALGFSEKDIDEVKGIFADTNLYFLLMTFIVAALHLLFDALAFKNDISFWRNRQNMIGVSSRTVVWRCISTLIIFLYLLDEETSLLVLIPTGIGAIIEVWKVKKAFKLKISWTGVKPIFQFESATEKEQMTEEYDSQAMKFLSWLLYPLCIAGAAYSLIYVQHKSWKSWTIQSLVNGVYAFGFLFMLPQLFVNYKLKSVAHLPWRAFMYKAFNTFIDDVFAFIITMPTAHRLACFRDDIVFVIYLYQRWLYPIDKTRVNEFGMAYEDDVNSDAKVMDNQNIPDKKTN